MKLQVLGSGSSGNCYILTSNDGHRLILEAGINIKDIKRGLGWKLTNIDGCLVSHRHQDHAKALQDIIGCGIRTLAYADVLESAGVNGSSFAIPIKDRKGYKVGNYRIMVLDVPHDVPCAAFVISHPDMGKTLFVTDTMYLPYVVKGLNHIMIECNYTDKALDYAIDNGITPASMRDRLLKTHMELHTTIEALKAHDLTNVNEVVLLHLSGHNSDRREMTDAVGSATGLPAYIAKAGLEIDLSNIPI